MQKIEIEKAWTLKDVMTFFNVKDSRTVTQKFIKQQGLKFFRVGTEYRFRTKDVLEFENYLKDLSQEEIISFIPIKPKRRYNAPKFDFEKKKINLEQLKVI